MALVLKAFWLRLPSSFVAVLAIGSMLLLADIGVVNVAKILAICLLQIYAGAELVEKFFYRRQLTMFERFGLGLPVGVAISIAFDLLFSRTVISQFAWMIPLVLIIALCRLAKSPLMQTSSVGRGREYESLVWVTTGLLAVLGQEWFWPMPVAIFGALAALVRFNYIGRYNEVKTQARVSNILGILGLLALTVGVLIRPYSWWIEDSDFGFYEAFTVSLSNWGTAENLLATGAGLRYHWFVYEWSGLVSKAGELPEWVMLSRGAIIVGSFSLVCLIWVILVCVTDRLRSVVFSLLIICFFDSVTSWGSGFRIGFVSSPSQLVGFVWLFAILLVLLAQDMQRVKFSPLLYGILFSGAMLSKISHGVVALGGLLLVVFVDMIKQRKLMVQRLLSAITAIVVSSFWFWHTYMGAENARFKFLKFPEEILGTLKLWGGKPLWFAAAILLLGLVGYQSMGLAVGLANQKLRNSTIYIFAMGAAVSGFIVTLSIESLFGSQLYFLHSASAIVLLVTAIATLESFVKLKNYYNSVWRVVFILIVGFLSAIVSWAIPTINSGSESAIWVSVSKSGTFAIPLFFSIALIFPSSLRSAFKRYIALGLIGLCGLGVGFSMTNWTMILKREFSSFDRNEEYNLGSKDLNSAMKWLRNSTPEDEIFASNNESFLLSALSQRRGLLQAEIYVRRHTVLDQQWSQQLASRRKLLDRAFKSMTQNDLQEFENFGVTTLVLDKSVPDFTMPDLSIGLSKVFENDAFVVLTIG